MELIQEYSTLFYGILSVLAIMLVFCLIRAVRGPRIADRIVSINMISTLSLAMIAILTRVLGESYLADVALIYALLGFLAVVVLCKVFMGIALEKKEQEEKKNG